jgi:putative membrane protein
MIDHRLSSKHYLSLGILGIAILVASIRPLEMEAYLLHQAGTVFMILMLIICLYKIGLTFFSFNLYIAFLLIHVLAAHYLYSYVPYNQWIEQIFHFNLNEMMHWSRNMYDRFVHLAFGLLLYPVFYRMFQVWLPQQKPFSIFLLVIQFVITGSVIYEGLEWLIAIGLSPDAAENYNGQQGDIWDAHKDVLLATLGAVLTGSLMLLHSSKKSPLK